MKHRFTRKTASKGGLLLIGVLWVCYFAAAQVFKVPQAGAALNKIIEERSLFKQASITGLAAEASIAPARDALMGKRHARWEGSASGERDMTPLTVNSAETSAAANSLAAYAQGPGGPILVISGSSNLYSGYTSEILLAEGLNQYYVTDLSDVTATMLSNYQVVILGSLPLTNAQVGMFSDWTNAGGTFISFRPDTKLASLLGITSTGGTLVDRYMLVDTSTEPGKGIVNQTIQYQSAADLYTLNGARAVASIYSGVNTSTAYPAVTMRSVGTSGGTAVAFTYDLARSIVYTRQGNPLWSGQKRDGQSGPIRSDDQFFPNWIDFSKVAIPQADEQQRLLANIILQNAGVPLPRFWYLPRGLKAAVVMTGDDHGNGGTKGRFDQYIQLSQDNSPEAVADWRAIRGTSYIYPNTPLTNAEARNYEAQGFEIALHLNTNCQNYSPNSLERDLTSQLSSFRNKYSSISAPVTNRTHCLAWSDWHTQPKVEAPKGIRLDANYYYWPSAWIQDRPGMFTGSGFPMRFADLDGAIIDCYQLATQMTDESDQSFPYTINQLLDKALGTEGYFGVFCANMHTDAATSDGSDEIIASAKSRNVPVISSKQLLTWLDGRNGSSFSTKSWNGNELNFSVSVASGARNLEGMLPMTELTGRLISLKENVTPVAFRIETIKGIEYAIFPCVTGDYIATFDADALPNRDPSITITSPSNGASYTDPASITMTASASDPDGNVVKVEFFQGSIKLGEDANGSDGWSFIWNGVTAGSYTLTARATDDRGALTTSAAINISVSATCPCTVFSASASPIGSLQNDGQALQLGMKFRSSTNGYVTGVRFYKQSGNTGTHTGQLYSASGQLLASVVFQNETASGWQQASFASPVAITANTTYLISYHSSAGHYSVSNNGFSQAVVNGPLTGLRSGVDGGNGVYRYTSSPAFPSSTYAASNYWVDAVFNTSASPGNQAPTVSLTNPSNNSTFTAPATINLSASASDADGSIAKVEFFQGTTKLGEDTNGGDGWSYTWNSVAAGTYQLTARATDNLGATTSSSSVSLTVNSPANQAPVVAITAPADNATFTAPASVTISATASDADGTVAKVEFYQGITKLGEDATSPYTFVWNGISTGSYQLSARATDNNNAVTTSAVVNITVSAPGNTPPSVLLTSPADNATFTAPASISLTADAMDSDGSISRVEFYQGNTKLGEDLNSPYSYTWNSVAAGTYQLTARAFDEGGLSTSSSPVNVTVSAAPSDCPCTVFQATAAPIGPLENDGQALQLGMKFRSSTNGYVTGVRFYKQSGNTGTHTGQLYSASGQLLASVVFQNETASGWQQASFSTPVAVTANTTYLISYHSSAGHYSVSNNGFSQAVANGPLTGLRSGVDGGNGVYRYTSSPAFPSSTYAASNYWVDAVFNTVLAAGSQAQAAVVAGDGSETGAQPTLVVFPNPSSGEATVSFALEEDSNYSLGLYDVTGGQVATLKQGYAPAGERHAIEVNMPKLPIGLYFVRLQTGSGVQTVRLFLIR